MASSERKGDLYLITGIPGTGVSAALRRYADQGYGSSIELKIEDEVARLANGKQACRKVLETRDDTLKSEAELDLQDILRLPWPILQQLWVEAAEATIAQIPDLLAKHNCVFLSFHCSWYPGQVRGLVTPVDVPRLQAFLSENQLEIRRSVTLIDDVYDVFVRLRRHGGLFENTTELEEKIADYQTILSWREFEIRLSQQLGNSLGCSDRHFVLAVKHPIATFHRLLTLDDARYCYLAHPISEPRRTELVDSASGGDIVQQVNEVAGTMRGHENVVLFEPARIDELRFGEALAEGAGYRWPHDDAMTLADPLKDEEQLEVDQPFKVENDEGELEFPQPELIDQAKAAFTALRWKIADQINWRDRLLVEQSPTVIQLRPFAGGGASGGVREELILHTALMELPAANRPKAIVYHPPSDELRRKAAAISNLVETFSEESSEMTLTGWDEDKQREFRVLITDRDFLQSLDSIEGARDRGAKLLEKLIEIGVSSKRKGGRLRSAMGIGEEGARRSRSELGAPIPELLDGSTRLEDFTLQQVQDGEHVVLLLDEIPDSKGLAAEILKAIQQA